MKINPSLNCFCFRSSSFLRTWWFLVAEHFSQALLLAFFPHWISGFRLWLTICHWLHFSCEAWHFAVGINLSWWRQFSPNWIRLLPFKRSYSALEVVAKHLSRWENCLCLEGISETRRSLDLWQIQWESETPQRSWMGLQCFCLFDSDCRTLSPWSFTLFLSHLRSHYFSFP